MKIKVRLLLTLHWLALSHMANSAAKESEMYSVIASPGRGERGYSDRLLALIRPKCIFY